MQIGGSPRRPGEGDAAAQARCRLALRLDRRGLRRHRHEPALCACAKRWSTRRMVASAESELLGVTSLLLWALLFIVTAKYVLFLMRADNRGEGGTLSLMALAQSAHGPVARRWCSCWAWPVPPCSTATRVITPAISVLSAIEGLEAGRRRCSTTSWSRSPSASCSLLFAVQRHGTGRVAALFGPITLVWFVAIGGARSRASSATTWRARRLQSACTRLAFLTSHGSIGFVVLGSVFLAVPVPRRSMPTWVILAAGRSRPPGSAWCSRPSR